ncbi:hypothetical protein PUNSTDRAFT_33123, partial [Punctularia strigosozonata HHB-11173 SS5]|uniref:uncharacterized protein n=1 Tax=Punctularia strigosozonata (strain HHB-11173) TaxID=741275 RepID=UPI00044186B8
SRMRTWLEHRSDFLDAILLHEAPRGSLDNEPCARCTSYNVLSSIHGPIDIGRFSCGECHPHILLCGPCVVEKHQKHPLHAINEWLDGCYHRRTLSELGLRVQLGHLDGSPCHNSVPGPNDFLVFDSEGYQHVNVRFCECSGRLRWQQLIDIGWYPASVDRPKTAFTFRFLDAFHRITLQGKISLHDYYLSVVNKTNCAGTDRPVYRYKEATLCTRQWENLLMLKRAGRAHDPSGIDATALGELAVLCPACPQDGWNLPDGWQDVPEDKKWLYTVFVALDACFRLKMKDRKIDDPELGSGWAYMVAERPYQDHLKKHPQKKENVPSCDSSFHAISNADSKVNSKVAVTGVGAAKCARHAFVRPHAAADLQKGERFVTMDYVFWTTLLVSTCVSFLVVSYDIACQWSVNLLRRITDGIEAGSYSSRFCALIEAPIRFFIPDFHIHGHGCKCQTKYAFPLNRGVGFSHGETTEQEWAHIGAVATSTREMGPAARHATLDDHWGFWNWRKTVALGPLLLRSLTTALRLQSKHRRVFTEFTATFPEDLVGKWEAMVQEWEVDHSKPDPFIEPEESTTFAAVRAELAEEEDVEVQRGVKSLHRLTAATFIRQGLALEDQIRKLRRDVEATTRVPTDDARASLKERRTSLRRLILAWYSVQNIYMPGAVTERDAQCHVSEDVEQQSIEAEDLPILLPSYFGDKLPKDACLRGCTSKEARLRVALLEDSLIELRHRRRTLVGLLRRYKIDENTGTRGGTRNREVLARLAAKIDMVVSRYRASYDAMTRLQPNGEWTKRFRELHDRDICGPYQSSREGETASRNREYAPSWIWTMGPIPGVSTRSDEAVDETSTSEASAEFMRNEWARERARYHRANEEVELSVAEMQRVLIFCKTKAAWWDKQASRRQVMDEHLGRSLRAYARRQAFMYREMTVAYASQWKPALVTAGLAKDW